MSSQVVFTEEGSDVATPATGKLALFSKNDSRLYHKDDAGVVRKIATETSSIALSVALAVALG